MADERDDNLRDLVAEVAAAYFSNSHVGVGDIGSVVEQIAKSLSALGETNAVVSVAESVPSARHLTSAQIRKSITPDALISFEDGKRYKTLRRHLGGKGLTPEEYRRKWGLPQDYPMVASAYSEARSRMAKALGLGNRRQAAPTPTRRRRGAGSTQAGNAAGET
jgi:predicted transcriptional regulator